MIKGLYAGYPAGLKAMGDAIGLAEDKKKLMTGKNLLKQFCLLQNILMMMHLQFITD